MSTVIFNTDVGAGLFSNINRIVTYLVNNPDTKKIVWSMTGQESGCMGYDTNNKELFSLLFEQFSEISDSDVTAVNVSTRWMEDSNITGYNVINYYLYREELRPYSNSFHTFLKFRPELNRQIELVKNALFHDTNDVVAIIVRGDALKDEQPRRKMPTRQEYINVIRKLPDNNKRKYFLCIDNEDDLQFFKSILPNHYHTNIRRSTTKNDIEPHKKTRGTEKDFYDSFLEVVYCSLCNILIHPVTNMATASLYMNMNQISVPII